jgi:hypothetical protein
MSIDLNQLPLDGNEDVVPEAGGVFPFVSPHQILHSFDLNIPMDEQQENLHPDKHSQKICRFYNMICTKLICVTDLANVDNELNVLEDYLNDYEVYADVDIVFDQDELSDSEDNEEEHEIQPGRLDLSHTQRQQIYEALLAIASLSLRQSLLAPMSSIFGLIVTGDFLRLIRVLRQQHSALILSSLATRSGW